MSCPAGVPGPCNGVLSLKKRKGKRRKLGHHAFSIASGHSARVRVRISKSGRRALRKRGSLKVRARAVATDRLGARGISSVKLKLKKKRKHKRR